MQPTPHPYTTLDQWEAMSHNRRVAEHQHLLVGYNGMADAARQRGGPPDRLEHREPMTWLQWHELPLREQYGIHLDVIVAYNDLADWLRHSGGAPAVTVQTNGIVPLTA